MLGYRPRSSAARRPQMPRVHLRAANGQYVCAEGGGGDNVVANRDLPREWETFVVELAGRPNFPMYAVADERDPADADNRLVTGVTLSDTGRLDGETLVETN